MPISFAGVSLSSPPELAQAGAAPAASAPRSRVPALSTQAPTVVVPADGRTRRPQLSTHRVSSDPVPAEAKKPVSANVQPPLPLSVPSSSTTSKRQADSPQIAEPAIDVAPLKAALPDAALARPQSGARPREDLAAGPDLLPAGDRVWRGLRPNLFKLISRPVPVDTLPTGPTLDSQPPLTGPFVSGEPSSQVVKTARVAPDVKLSEPGQPKPNEPKAVDDKKLPTNQPELSSAMTKLGNQQLNTEPSPVAAGSAKPEKEIAATFDNSQPGDGAGRAEPLTTYTAGQQSTREAVTPTDSRIDGRPILRAVAERLEQLASRPGETITIRLDPADLGTVTLSLRSFDGKVEAQIGASSDQVRRALEAGSSQLGRALESKGIQVSQMSFSSDLASGNQPSGQGGHQPHGLKEHQRAATFQPEQAHASAEAGRELRRSAGGFDLWT
mgnify:CR=1 FL=1